MTNIKYFCDTRDGQTIELVDPCYFGAGIWRGSDPVSRDNMPVTRRVKIKSNPSLHACDSRCRNARGGVISCECACGGKNHGKHAEKITASIKHQPPTAHWARGE